MIRSPLTRDQLSRLDAAILRAKVEADRNPAAFPHPDDARPVIVHWPSVREIDIAILKERARLAIQYPHLDEPMPPPGLIASARLP